MDLAAYKVTDYSPGRSRLVQVLWYVCSAVVFQSQFFPFSPLKTWLLRAFGAQVGTGVVVKPAVRIKFPWRLQVGDHAWIGESVWIDNLATVRIGSNVCISQGAYLCTGSHNHRLPGFDLITRPIEIADRVWICAMAVLLPGTVIASDCVIAAGAVVSGSISSGMLVRPCETQCSLLPFKSQI
jgi:putative colanic acid biosynthesis acetyltransferase WcaF